MNLKYKYNSCTCLSNSMRPTLFIFIGNLLLKFACTVSIPLPYFFFIILHIFYMNNSRKKCSACEMEKQTTPNTRKKRDCSKLIVF